MPSDLDVIFQSEFELGMDELWKTRSAFAQTALIDMGVYFNRFEPPGDGSDLYTALIQLLQETQILGRTALATLNYECILELSAEQLGLNTHYLAQAPSGNELVLYKPHGSCNLLAPASFFGMVIKDAPNYYVGPVDPVHPKKALELFARGFSIPPAMSLFAPGKFTPVAKDFADESRQHWANWCLNATHVVIIGARPFLADAHVWKPLIDSRTEVWYIGGTAGRDFDAFRDVLGSRFYYMGSRFREAFPTLEARVKLLA